MTDAELQKNRFLAMAIDAGVAIVLSGVFFVISLVLSIALTAAVGSLTGSIVSGLMSIVGAVLILGFILLRDILLKGKSVGKHFMKIQTVTTAGSPISMMHSARRNFVFAVPTLVWLLHAVVSLVVNWIPGLNCCVGIVFAILAFIVCLGVIAFTVWEIITITKDPEGIRWGDKFAGTKVTK